MYNSREKAVIVFVVSRQKLNRGRFLYEFQFGLIIKSLEGFQFFFNFYFNYLLFQEVTEEQNQLFLHLASLKLKESGW